MFSGRHVIFIFSLLQIFAVDGHDWGSWEHWSGCSSTCSTAYSHRSRTCLRHPCQGEAVQSMRCGTFMCHGDGGWSPWTPLSSCIVSCGTSIRLMQRFCNNPAPLPGGRFCEGKSIGSEPCYGPPCSLVSVIDGKWGSWSAWSSCTATYTRKYRHRICNNPAPNFGGKFCLGQNFETLTCSVATSPLASTLSPVTTTTDAATPSPPARHVTRATTTDAVTPSPPPRHVTTHHPVSTTTDAVTPSPPPRRRSTQHIPIRVFITK